MTKIGDIESFDYSLLATEATLNQVSGTVDEIDIVLGEKLDLVTVPYMAGSSSALAYLRTGYYHVHGASFIYPKYVTPIQLTSNAASWNTTGTKVEVIPADAITKNFDLHWCSISEISADLFGIVDIYSGEIGSEVLIGSVDVSRTTSQSRENAAPVQIPQQPANTRISCRFSDSTSSARTVRIKFYGHVYSTTL
jgi:hypothetical protein